MAISLDIEQSQYGVPFNGAYFRIVTVQIHRQRLSDGSKFVAYISVAGYGTNEPTDETKNIDFRQYVASLDVIETQSGDTFLNKCYSFVMSQPDMLKSVAV